MEAEDMEAVAKPDYSPDYVTTYGSAYWWVLMVRMDAVGGFQRIAIDQETGDFYIVLSNEKKKAFNSNIKQQYDKWLYETFESKFMGNVSDEDTTTKS